MKHLHQRRRDYDREFNSGEWRHGLGYDADNLDRIAVIAGALETISSAADLAAVKAAAATAVTELNKYHLEQDLWAWRFARGYANGFPRMTMHNHMVRAARHLPTNVTDAQFRMVVEQVMWGHYSARKAMFMPGENEESPALYTRALAGTLATQVGGIGIWKDKYATPAPTCRVRWGPPADTHADHFDSDRPADVFKGLIPWDKLPSARITSTTSDAAFIINLNNPQLAAKDVHFYCIIGGEGGQPPAAKMVNFTDHSIAIPLGCEVRFAITDKGQAAPADPPMKDTAPEPMSESDSRTHPGPEDAPDPNAPTPPDDDDDGDAPSDES